MNIEILKALLQNMQETANLAFGVSLLSVLISFVALGFALRRR